MESVAGLPWNRWQLCYGISGRVRPEYAGKAAELAGLTRADFLDELHQRKVPACQVTPEELADEIHGA